MSLYSDHDGFRIPSKHGRERHRTLPFAIAGVAFIIAAVLLYALQGKEEEAPPPRTRSVADAPKQQPLTEAHQAEAAEPTCKYPQYQVKPGDTLSKISRLFELAPGELRKHNQLESDRILVGQHIEIPRCSSSHIKAPTNEETPLLGVDPDFLPLYFQKLAVELPATAKILVIRFDFDQTRRSIVGTRAYDNRGKSTDRSWSPGTLFALPSAAAALRKARQLGFSPAAHFEGFSKPLSDQVEEALIHGRREAIEELTRLASGGQFWRPDESCEPVGSHVLTEGAHRVEISWGSLAPLKEAQNGGELDLRDFAKLLSEVMLQEQLQPQPSNSFEAGDLLLLRRSLRARAAQASCNLDILLANENHRLYGQCSRHGGWRSAVVYIFEPGESSSWLVAIAAQQRLAPLIKGVAAFIQDPNREAPLNPQSLQPPQESSLAQ